MTASWRTTACGGLTLLTTAVTMIVVPLLNGGQPQLTEFIAVAIPAIGLLFARDNKVSSEQAGAK